MPYSEYFLDREYALSVCTQHPFCPSLPPEQANRSVFRTAYLLWLHDLNDLSTIHLNHITQLLLWSTEHLPDSADSVLEARAAVECACRSVILQTPPPAIPHCICALPTIWTRSMPPCPFRNSHICSMSTAHIFRALFRAISGVPSCSCYTVGARWRPLICCTLPGSFFLSTNLLIVLVTPLYTTSARFFSTIPASLHRSFARASAFLRPHSTPLA